VCVCVCVRVRVRVRVCVCVCARARVTKLMEKYLHPFVIHSWMGIYMLTYWFLNTESQNVS
jgi:hypothetical protein